MQYPVLFIRARHIDTDVPEIEQYQVAAQRIACERAAERLGVIPIREYVEYGGTGDIESRPELRLMLTELQALHDASYVITTSADRLSQRTSDLAAIRFDIEAAGARLVVADLSQEEPMIHGRTALQVTALTDYSARTIRV